MIIQSSRKPQYKGLQYSNKLKAVSVLVSHLKLDEITPSNITHANISKPVENIFQETSITDLQLSAQSSLDNYGQQIGHF